MKAKGAKMKVRHFLKDGKEAGSVAGTRLPPDQFSVIYKIRDAINERNNDNVRKTGSKDLA